MPNYALRSPSARTFANSLFHKASRLMRKTKGFAILDRTLLPFWAFFALFFAPWLPRFRHWSVKLNFPDPRDIAFGLGD